MTRDYLKFMTSDLLMQFRGEECRNNRILLSALAKQLDDVYEMFQQLEERTFLRKIDANEFGELLNNGAHKIHLDRLGEIVDISRKQATVVSNKLESVEDLEKSNEINSDTLVNFIKSNFATYYPGDALCDSEYSEYLYYKIFLNNSYCTYADVIKSLEMFWNKTPIYYREEPEKPASIFLSTPKLKPEQNARMFFLAPVVKAAGVQLFREAVTEDYLRNKNVYVGAGLFSGVIQCTLPYLVIEHSYSEVIKPSTRLENISQDDLSLMNIYNIIFDGEFTDNGFTAMLKADEYEAGHTTLVYPAMLNGNIVRVLSIPFDSYKKVSNNSVTDIRIPSTVEYIEEGCFNNFSKLESIVVPKNIKRIYPYAFASCGSMKRAEISLNSKIKNIESFSFYNCTSLEEVVIPETVTSIALRSFKGCDNIKRVVFGGTEEQWSKILKTRENGTLFSAEIEFLGGPVE